MRNYRIELVLCLVCVLQRRIESRYLEVRRSSIYPGSRYNYSLSKGLNVNLGDALRFLREYDREASFMCNRVMVAQWNFVTNITDTNRQKMVG